MSAQRRILPFQCASLQRIPIKEVLMKRAMFLAALLFLPACSDTPTQAPLDVQP